jgi:hypothetical protein
MIAAQLMEPAAAGPSFFCRNTSIRNELRQAVNRDAYLFTNRANWDWETSLRAKIGLDCGIYHNDRRYLF